jgi:hypothetical protein
MNLYNAIHTMSYLCPRCDYRTDKKQNIIRHIHNIKLCEFLSIDVIPKSYEKYILIGADMSNEIIMDKIEIDKLKKEVEELRKNNRSSNVYNNNIIFNNKNTFNITIHNYDHPNIEYITANHYRHCMNQNKNAYLEMFKVIYRNPSHPENHSVHKTNSKNKHIRYFENGKWLIGNQNNIIPKLIDAVYDGLCKESTDDRFNDLALLLDTDQKFKEKVHNDILIETHNSID